ncbi:rhodanese-like domain-containing protein [Thalassotalea atypica]|uniref:rhodanese-like domain-containing protein n=1 Tax=Thalassotalea atypica TaxID=2054316 RepID=UPI0025730A5D|nr:rhodanese-like domain-containing protein [Thalassotalea atypica]
MKRFNFMLAIVLVLTSLYANANERATFTQPQLVSLQAAPLAPAYTLLDVRSAKEYQAGHIKGALNISHSTLGEQLNLMPQDKDQMVIVYCRSGRRAGIAEQLLKAKGYTQVKHLSGDMNGWLESNLPVESH